MAMRKIKDAKDLDTGELIYIKGHAKATFMSDGRTVEEAITASSGGSPSGDILEALTSDEISEIYFNNFNITVYFGSGVSGDGISAALAEESENIEEPIDEPSIE